MDRRTFLKHAGAGVVGLGALRPLRAWAEEEPAPQRTLPENWTWGRLRAEWDETRRAQYFDDIAAAGVKGVLLRGTNDERALALARARDLEVHAWRWTLCRGGKLIEEHPEWYAVSREGVSTAKKPPYVSYYRFLCPTREDVIEYLVRDYAEVAAREGLAGVHLDYVRYPDVILPKALWGKYDLVQHEELPEFDFCYCDVCRAAFRKATGEDPLKLPNPPSSAAWRTFRYDRITKLVGRIAKAVHAHGKFVSAAVFPTPTIARRLVRQDWARWDLDAVMPMAYQHFYEKPVAWIEEAVREGVTALAGSRPLFPGLYLPALKAEGAYAEAVARARQGGATGIALFGGVRQIPAR